MKYINNKLNSLFCFIILLIIFIKTNMVYIKITYLGIKLLLMSFYLIEGQLDVVDLLSLGANDVENTSISKWVNFSSQPQPQMPPTGDGNGNNGTGTSNENNVYGQPRLTPSPSPSPADNVNVNDYGTRSFPTGPVSNPEEVLNRNIAGPERTSRIERLAFEYRHRPDVAIQDGYEGEMNEIHRARDQALNSIQTRSQAAETRTTSIYAVAASMRGSFALGNPGNVTWEELHPEDSTEETPIDDPSPSPPRNRPTEGGPIDGPTTPPGYRGRPATPIDDADLPPRYRGRPASPIDESIPLSPRNRPDSNS
jgi:hypothetical protein